MEDKNIFDTEANNDNTSKPCRECDIETANEFTKSPEEFNGTNIDIPVEGMPEYVNAPEQAIRSDRTSVRNEYNTTTDGNSEAESFFNAPGVIAPLGKNKTTNPVDTTDLSGLYDEPTDKYDCGDGCGCGHKRNDDGCGCGDDCGCDYGEAYETTHSPEDETAATCDNQTVKAREHCALDDYEIISDVLGCEKQLVNLYSTALCESAEEPLRDIFRNNLMEAAADQYSTFEYMQKRGMYPTDTASEENVTQAKQHFRPLCDRW